MAVMSGGGMGEMKEMEISWSEITLKEMSDLAERLSGIVEVDGDRHTVLIRYEEAQNER